MRIISILAGIIMEKKEKESRYYEQSWFLKPISYDPVNNVYIGLGSKVGNAFKDGLKLK